MTAETKVSRKKAALKKQLERPPAKKSASNNNIINELYDEDTAKSQSLPSVLQAFILTALAEIIYHHLMTRAMNHAMRSEAWTNFMGAMEMFENITQSAHNGSIYNEVIANGTIDPGYNLPLAQALDGTQMWNSTGARMNFPSQSGGIGGIWGEQESFYWQILPRTLLIIALTLPLNYHWQLWLERTFPGRVRKSSEPALAPPSPSTKEKEPLIGDKDDEAAGRGKAAVQKKIAGEKVRRATLGWVNTFAKWLLDMTIGQAWKDGVVYFVLYGLVKRQEVYSIWMGLKWGLLYRPWIAYFSLRPLASMLSFITLPAHERIVFLAGADLLWNTFVGLFVGVFIPWLSTKQFVWDYIGNMTTGIGTAGEDIAENGFATLPGGNRTRIADEL